MKNYNIKTISIYKAKEVIEKHHYSKSFHWPMGKYNLGLHLNEKLVGVITIGYPAGRNVRNSISSLIKDSHVFELTRMWVNDKEARNTESFFIGKMFKWLRENTEVKVLISYSDPNYNHLGFIYQATNWLYQGSPEYAYQHYVFGKWLHPRSCMEKYYTTRSRELKKIDKNYNRRRLLGRHRYVYILNKRERKTVINNLYLPILEYPKFIQERRTKKKEKCRRKTKSNGGREMSPDFNVTGLKHPYEFAVEHNINIPDEATSTERRKKYPFRVLRVGDSFFVPAKLTDQKRVINNVKSCAYNYNLNQKSSSNRVNIAFHCRQENNREGIRFWRVDRS